MGAGRKTQTIQVNETPTSYPVNRNYSVSAKNLPKSDLGGAIFGCTHSTITECFSKQLFGLPSWHFSYVRNVKQGLPLFLFNYDDRKMHGIFEAASHGEMNIDPYAWIDVGAERTAFPAQVRIRIRVQCQPVTENVFKKAIEDNYYAPDCPHYFWFELDHAQTRGLTALFKPSPFPVKNLPPPIISKKSNSSVVLTATQAKGKASINTEAASGWVTEANLNPVSFVNIVKGNKFASLCLDEVDSENGSSSKTSSNIFEDSESKDQVSDWEDLVEIPVIQPDAIFDLNAENRSLQEQHPSDEEYENEVERVLSKLKKLSADSECFDSSSKCSDNNTFQSSHANRGETSGQHSDEDNFLAAKNAKPDLYHASNTNKIVKILLVQIIRELKDQNMNLQSKQVETDREMQRLEEIVKDSARKIDNLNSRVLELEWRIHHSTGENIIYLIGGFNGSSWLSSLDSFSPSFDRLTPLKAMSTVRSYASATALDGNIFIFGGCESAHRKSWYKTVECYNPQCNEWTSCPDMICAKANLAGAALNGKIFAIGGEDGRQCYSDVEMFDPALGRWIKYQPMLQQRKALAAAELNGALYAVGGCNRTHYLQTAERYDPRESRWTKLSSMKTGRIGLSLAILNEKLHAIGGYDMETPLASVEILDPRMDSWVMGKPMNYSRAYAAAVVLGDSLYAIGGIQQPEKLETTVECYNEGNDWIISGLEAVGKRSFFSAIVP